MRDIAVGVCDGRRVRGVVLVSRVRPRGRCRGSRRVRGVVVVVGRGFASLPLSVTFDRRLLGP